MSNEIDNRTVQMDFENKKFESGVEESLKSIEDLKKGLDFTGSAKGLDEINTSAKGINLDGISAGVNALKERFSLMGIVGITIIQRLTNAVLDLAKGFIDVAVGAEAIRGGFAEYEAGIKSFQTILANTKSSGETIETVTDALLKLNEYANKTTYSFGDMNDAIGKFTAQGVKLDESLVGIKGIYNLVSLTGGTSEKASRAIYTLAQGIASGTIRLRQWESLVAAGVAGPDFQEQIKATARVHGIAVDKMIEEEGSFRDSISKGWITKEVLLETLAKYTGDLNKEALIAMGYTEEQAIEMEALGKAALDASTRVKTVTQLIGLLKSNMVTSWAESFRIIVGNLDEASELWTKIGDILGNVFATTADARNELLQTWKDLGGRKVLLDSLFRILDELPNLVKPIGDAFREIFPPVTAQKLYEITVNIGNLLDKFKIGADSADKIRRVFKGFFALLDIGRMLFLAIAKAAFGFSDSLKPVGEFLSDVVLSISDYIVNLRDGIQRTDGFTTAIGKFVDFIRPGVDKVKGFFGGIVEGIKAFKNVDTSGIPAFLDKLSIRFEPLRKLFGIFGKALLLIGSILEKVAPILFRLGSLAGEAISGFIDRATKALSDFDPDSVLRTLNVGFFGALLVTLKNFIKNGPSLFVDIRFMLSNLGTTLAVWQTQLKAETLIKIATAIAILALSLLGLSFVDPKRLASATAAISAMFVELSVAMRSLSTVKSGFGLAGVTAAMIGLATALLIMSGAIAILGTLDTDQLTRATIALTVIMALMQKTAIGLAKAGPGVVSSAGGVAIFAVGLLIITKAIEKLGNMNTGVLIQGLLGLSGLLVVLGTFLKLAGGSQSMILASTGILILSVALLALTGVITILGNMPMNKIMQSLLTIAIALGVVGAAMNVMPPNMLITSAALLVVSAALVVLSEALKSLGGMTWDEVSISLVTLAASLTILGIAMSAMSGMILGAGALLIAAAALAILAVSLKLIGSMSLEEIGLALLAIAGVLTVLGVAASILTPLLPSLAGLALVLLLIGVAMLAAGAGMLAFGVGLSVLGTSAGIAGAGLVVLITSMVSLLPMIAQQLGRALIALVTTVADGAPLLLEAIITLLMMIVDALIEIIPKVVDGILLLVTELLTSLAASLPDIVQAGYDILIAILEGISNNIEDVVIIAIDIIKTFITIFGQELPALIDAGQNMMIDFIDGLADAMEKNIPRMMESVRHLGLAIIKGIVTGIAEGQGQVGAAIWDLGKSIISTFSQAIDSNSPSEEFKDQAGYITGGLVVGIKKYAGSVYSAARNLAEETITQFSSVLSKISDTIESEGDLNPTIRPVMDLSNIVAGSSEMGDIVSGTNLNVSATAKRTQGISTSTGESAQQSVNDSGDTKQSVIHFEQNNYSPKELSRVDIYRQTKNQLFQAKELVGAK